jgi:hypothetical protein
MQPVPTKTVGAARARNVLRDFVVKHAPDRAWGARGTIIDDTQNPGKLGLQIQGDPGYFPVGTWAWLHAAGLDALVVDALLSPLLTADTDVGDHGGHHHQFALPIELEPLKVGDEVFVIWMDPNAQHPLVLGKIEFSH